MHYSSIADKHACSVATIFVQWYTSDMFTVLIVTQLIAMTLYLSHICIYIFHTSLSEIWHILHICQIWGAYLFVGHIQQKTGEICTAVGCVLAHICKNSWSICPFNMLVVWFKYGMWQSYLFSNICLHRPYALCRVLYRQLLHSSVLYM